MASDLIIPWQIDGETMKKLTNFIFLGSNITTDNDCNHEIKRHLLLWRKAISKQHIKKQNITLPHILRNSLRDAVESQEGFQACKPVSVASASLDLVVLDVCRRKNRASVCWDLVTILPELDFLKGMVKALCNNNWHFIESLVSTRHWGSYVY